MKTLKRNSFATMAASCIICVSTLISEPSAAVAEYPDRPIDFIVTWGAGGGSDKFARMLAPLVEEKIGVAVPVSNVPGAAGNKGLGKLKAGRADAYSFATMTGVTFSSLASGKSPYKIDDFEWLVRVQVTPSMMFVKADSKFKTFEDIVKYAKANPGKLNVGTDGFGTPADLTLKYLATKGIEMKNIPFDKPAERYTAPLSGQVDVLYEEPGDVREFLVSGKIRPLIVFDNKRFEGYDIPSSKDLGYDVALYNWRGLVMKAGTSGERIEVLANSIRKAMENEKWQKFCDKNWTCDADSPSGATFKSWAEDQMKQLKAFASSN